MKTKTLPGIVTKPRTGVRSSKFVLHQAFLPTLALNTNLAVKGWTSIRQTAVAKERVI